MYGPGYVSSEYGSVESARVYQQDAVFWILEVVFSIDSPDYSWSSSRDKDDEGKHASGTSSTATRSELNCRMMSLPLENHINYRKNWNYNLYSCVPGAPIPDFWWNAGRDFIPPNGFFFGKSFADCPPSWPNTNTYLMCLMTKPGVDGWDFPSYELIETSRHNKKKDAQWVLSKRSNTICDPIKGDFGIVERFGGNWKCDGGSITWDGRKWATRLTYTYSLTGWDQQIYADTRDIEHTT